MKLKKVHKAKWRPAIGDTDKGIKRKNIGPIGRDGTQLIVFIMKIHSILTPIVTNGYKLKRAATQRMKWMSDLESLGSTCLIGCT